MLVHVAKSSRQLFALVIGAVCLCEDEKKKKKQKHLRVRRGKKFARKKKSTCSRAVPRNNCTIEKLDEHCTRTESSGLPSR